MPEKQPEMRGTGGNTVVESYHRNVGGSIVVHPNIPPRFIANLVSLFARSVLLFLNSIPDQLSTCWRPEFHTSKSERKNYLNLDEQFVTKCISTV